MLDPLHRRLWEHHYKRNCWKDKEIKALVGWNEELEPTRLEKPPFLHVEVDSDPYKRWGYDLDLDSTIGLVWVDHANNIKFCRENTPNLLSAKEDTESFMEPIIFAETFDSLSRHRSVLRNQKDEDEKVKVSGDELIAAALARVIILDERVQSLMDDIYRADMPYATLLPCMGIWIPTTERSDLNNPNCKSIKCFLDKPTEKCEQLPADFLVLHLTILENLAKQSSKTEQRVLDDLRECKGVGKDCEIVIVSGRGIPSATLNSDIGVKALNERFLPISALLEHVSQPSKLALMHALWSA